MVKTHCRNVHIAFREDLKRDWGKASIEWGVLSVEEKRLARDEVRSRCGEGMFGAAVPIDAIDQGITARLFHLRRDWVAESSKQPAKFGSASSPSGPVATQNATEEKEARPFDPARHLNKEDDP